MFNLKKVLFYYRYYIRYRYTCGNINSVEILKIILKSILDYKKK